MVFGRKKRQDDVDDAAALPDDAGAATAEAGEASEPEPDPRPTGPWDVDEAPEDGVSRLDLGGLRVPVPEGMEIRVDVSPEGEVVAAVAVDRASQLQLNAFAAPRREGIWAEVRAEIATSLNGQGGSAEDVEGPFGRELRARVPAGSPGQTTPARFLGVDGPRWFVRGLVTGPAATDPGAAARLHDVFRQVVVVRGKDAMAPRDALPLHLPKDASATRLEPGEEAAADAESPPDAPAHADDFNPFERGPEITEIH